MHVRQNNCQSLLRCEGRERVLERFSKFPALGPFLRNRRIIGDVDPSSFLTHRPVQGNGRTGPAAPHLVVARVGGDAEEP